MRSRFCRGWMVVALLAALWSKASWGADAAVVTRSITMEECIQGALEHNLSLQIERLNPRIARYFLDGSYSYYDPIFSIRGSQNFRSSPGGFDSSLNLSTPPTETWSENYLSSVGGYAPSGLRYDLSASVSRSSGRFPVFDDLTTNFFQQTRPYEYRTDVGINFTQPLLRNGWTDATRTQIKVNRRDLKISELVLQQRINELVTAVRKAYFDLIFARENVKVQAKAVELAEQLLRENKRKVEIGTMAPLDEEQAKSQAASARAALLGAENDLSSKENVLKNNLTDRYPEWHRTKLVPTESLLSVPETYDLEESWNNGIRLRPEYNQLKQEIEKQDILLKYARNQLFPELDLFGTVGRSGLSGGSISGSLGDAVERIRGGDNPRWGGGGVLTVPFTFRAERNNFKRTKEQKLQAVLKLKQLEQTILVDIDDAVRAAQTDYQKIDATRQARVYAESALDAEQKKLTAGKSTTFAVLGLQKSLTQARSDEISALADYNKALADLYLKEGTTLPRNKITVEMK